MQSGLGPPVSAEVLPPVELQVHRRDAAARCEHADAQRFLAGHAPVRGLVRRWKHANLRRRQRGDALEAVHAETREGAILRLARPEVSNHLAHVRPPAAAVDDELQSPRPRLVELERRAVGSIRVVGDGGGHHGFPVGREHREVDDVAAGGSQVTEPVRRVHRER